MRQTSSCYGTVTLNKPEVYADVIIPGAKLKDLSDVQALSL